MKKEIVVENFRKSPSNIHHLIVVGEDKTLCGLNKNEDSLLWEIQEEGEGFVCKNCQKALFNLKKEREKENDCGCDDCGDDCKCEKQEEIPFKNTISKEIVFVKKSTSKIQHMAIKGDRKTFCGLTRKDPRQWEYQSLADNSLCKNCSRSFAKSNGRLEDFHYGCDDEDVLEEVGGDECVEKEEESRHARILRKSAYGFPKAPNDPMPYDMVKRRMELEERNFGLEEIKAIMYNEFFGMDMVQLERDCNSPECDPRFESTTIGLTSRASKSQSDESLGLNVDDHKEIFDELNHLYRKGILPISVIHRLFGTDIDGSLDRTERFIELVQSTPTITDEVRQSGKEALEETFMKWKDSCVSGNKKLPDHEFFYRIMKIQEVLS